VENTSSTRPVVFDFRSDTVTIPTQPMLQAMITAEVGDDVKDEDPTVHKLQKHVSSLCKKPASLFVCSGVMSNQLGIRSLVTENLIEHSANNIVIQTVICDYRSHAYIHELGGIAFHTQCQVLPLIPEEGKTHLTAEQIEKHIFLKIDMHTPCTTIISLENTLHGFVFPLEEIKKIRDLANKHKIKMHLDGARLWNACVATGTELHEWTQYFDSVSLCCSKGLGAPIGSLLVGETSLIAKAKQYRKLFGGGWRQAGYLAQCCLYAIENHWKRLEEDHAHAKLLFSELEPLGFESEGGKPVTNMLWLSSRKLNIPMAIVIQELRDLQAKQQDNEKILLDEEAPYLTRIVMHIQITKRGVIKLANYLKQIAQSHKTT